jgi:hypothetical protein
MRCDLAQRLLHPQICCCDRTGSRLSNCAFSRALIAVVVLA